MSSAAAAFAAAFALAFPLAFALAVTLPFAFGRGTPDTSSAAAVFAAAFALAFAFALADAHFSAIASWIAAAAADTASFSLVQEVSAQLQVRPRRRLWVLQKRHHP